MRRHSQSEDGSAPSPSIIPKNVEAAEVFICSRF